MTVQPGTRDEESTVPAKTPTERALAARIGAHGKWAQTDDRTAATQAARDAFIERFRNEADPEGKLDPDERARRGENLRKQYYARLALRSAQARRRAREQTEAAEAAEAELAELTAQDGAA